ncbi:MAG: acyl-CoA dehydrogenase family protein [Proteobacteria bacterium]|nr:acyl-CoA dehydrogenase family protein [Pseudomonadota bacterium]MBS0462070.1 acyl-CoA dehydrogenase family protein [Pseudomonadota bacterium]MBS0463525.1 acyl-CoA dehydrogenase family protein [Pseudomonadota bacterium]
MDTRSRFATHVVENQPPPLLPCDLYATDAPLREALAREGGAWAEAEIAAYGKLAGGSLGECSQLANANRPQLHTHDRYGHRIDEVEFHPAYHELMRTAIAHGVPNFGWRHADRPGAQVARAALTYLHYQADPGSSCPLTMTAACVPALRHAPDLAASWLPRILATHYDGRHVPAWDKPGNTIGMGMTEKQGGSDVRANTTRAIAVGDGLYELIGHKFFFSAPMSDAFLVTAQTDAGPTCFLMPRFAPDGSRNGMRLQRLKDKLGDWSNASSEVEFTGALAWRVGEEGRGIATILEMVGMTRLDCLLGSAALIRHALVQALHHCKYRRAFGKRLVEQPLMRVVLADLALESEAATALALRVARAVDASARDAHEAAFARVATAIGKFWVCNRAVGVAAEAQECLGGPGYIEDSGMPKWYRQAPVNAIWEGSGNVQCLDVLRALRREPESAHALRAELALARGAHPALDAAVDALDAPLAAADGDGLQARARWLVERMALCLQAGLLFRAGYSTLAAAFCVARLQGHAGLAYGTLPVDAPVATLLARAWPQ